MKSCHSSSRRRSFFVLVIAQLLTIQFSLLDLIHNNDRIKRHILFCHGATFTASSPLISSSAMASSVAFSFTSSSSSIKARRIGGIRSSRSSSTSAFLRRDHPFAFGSTNSRTRHTPSESRSSSSSSSSSLITTPTPSTVTRSRIATSSIATASTSALYCQLLGMNCATPTDFTFSFKGFIQRGGETDIHSDGWGVAFYQSNGLRAFHDDSPASYSPLSRFLTDHPVRTLNMMSHIRYAMVGKVDLSNVHPFTREMWGIQWCFAHNGDVPMFDSKIHNGTLPLLLGNGNKKDRNNNNKHNKDDIIYHPVGQTDSEAIFCAILNTLRKKFKTTMPSLPILYDEIQSLCNEIVQYDSKNTILNFLLSCGPNNLWAYSYPGKRPNSSTWNGLYYTVREYPFHKCQLCDMDYSVDFSLTNGKGDRVSIIATAPLTTDEEWIEFQKGELILFDEGSPNKQPEQLFKVELHGHGLTNSSSVLGPPKLEMDMRQYHFNQDFFVGGGI